MNLSLAVIILSVCSTGVLGVSLEPNTIPCILLDQEVSTKLENLYNSTFENAIIKIVHRNASLHFGHLVQGPVSKAPTFLVSGKVDMRKFLRVPVDQMTCVIHRHSRGVASVRWPKMGGEKHDVWYECILKDSRPHTAQTIVSYLRVNPTTTMSEHLPDYKNWPPIRDGENISASVAMVLTTYTPLVRGRRGRPQKLHCAYQVDHKAPDVTVEWHLWPGATGRTLLYSYARRGGTGGVKKLSLVDIARGDATYSIPSAKMEDQGTYTCTVRVPPVQGSLEVRLDVVEPPLVSLVRSGETLECEAKGYTPLDVHFQFLKESSNGSGVSERLDPPVYRGHSNLPDTTYTKTAFLGLLPEETGRYTCEVTHVSLDEPIRVSIFVSASWMDSLLTWKGLAVITLFLMLIIILNRVWKDYSEQKRKPF